MTFTETKIESLQNSLDAIYTRLDGVQDRLVDAICDVRDETPGAELNVRRAATELARAESELMRSLKRFDQCLGKKSSAQRRAAKAA